MQKRSCSRTRTAVAVVEFGRVDRQKKLLFGLRIRAGFL
jgi:hypothetical protein